MGGSAEVNRSKLEDMAIPKNAIHNAGWTRDETRSVLNR